MTFVGLCGCGSRAQASGPVTELSFWNGFSGPDGAAMEKIVKAFNKANPDVRVKMQIIPWATYYDKVTLGLAFGQPPDIFVLHANRVPEFAEHGALEPLDAYVQKSGLGPSDFVPKAWGAGVWKDTRFGLPLDCHPLGMYYNVKLFEEAGIEKPPVTQEEFLADAKKLTKDTDGDGQPDQWGFAITDTHLVGTSTLYQFGGGLVDKQMTHSIVDSPQTRAGIDFMLRMIYQEKICPAPGASDAWMGFQTGKVAMAPQGIWMIDSLDKLKDFKYAAAPMPLLGPVKAVWAGSHNLCMPAKNSAARKEAAFRFIKYLSDNSIEWARGGQVPVRTQVLQSPEFQALRIQREFAKQLGYVQFEPMSLLINQMSPFGDAALEATLNRSEPPERALKTAARRVNQVLARQ
jgi:multiple sugar transport system substrate-binding protein